MNRPRRPEWLLALLLPLLFVVAYAATLSTASLTLVSGETASVALSATRGKVRLANSNPDVAAATLSSSTVLVTGKSVGSSVLTVRDRTGTNTITVTVNPPLSVSPASLRISSGQTATLTVSNPSGSITLINSDASKLSASVTGNTITVTGQEAGGATLTIRDAKTAVVIPVAVTSTTGGSSGGTASSYTLLAWNDLGMHCIDADYSVFSILPLYNNLHAQLVNSSTGKLVTSGVGLTYEATTDPTGSKNSISSTKTNFWTYVQNFFGDLAADMGLAGNRMASDTPQPMTFDDAAKIFKAEGIPITPYDDNLHKNTYPLVKVVARDSAGKELASARVVLPVSDEMSCKSCHASGSGTAAKPAAGWVSVADAERDYRLNILRLHDERSSTHLYDDAVVGKPALCASCHASNALPGTGKPGIKPLTESMHATHASAIDPANGLKLDDSANRSACYQCHPGSETKCLRGAMSGSDLQCQSCHGKMSHVGRTGRVGWLEEPNCQACHHDGTRELAAVSSTGLLKTWLDRRFATNPNTPSSGFSLYRMSKGHGNVECEGCHGATHAEYASAPTDPNLPASHYNDNLLAQDIQGHAGTIGECSVCHKSVPLTASGGPHGMHTTGQIWVKEHHDMMPGDHNPSGCAYCHGGDYRGSPLATVKADRTFKIGDGRTKSYTSGEPVGCYDCHRGPGGG